MRGSRSGGHASGHGRRGPVRRVIGPSSAMLLALGVACAHPGGPPDRPAEPPAARPGSAVPRARPPVPRVQEGIASFYSRALAGRRTASGERYDPEQSTAAHRSLPFGTIVRVERLDGNGGKRGAAVEVRINDRGPFVEGRIIDLSGSAARELGIEHVGLAPVRVHVVSLP